MKKEIPNRGSIFAQRMNIKKLHCDITTVCSHSAIHGVKIHCFHSVFFMWTTVTLSRRDHSVFTPWQFTVLKCQCFHTVFTLCSPCGEHCDNYHSVFTQWRFTV